MKLKRTVLALLASAAFPVIAGNYVIRIPSLQLDSTSVELPLEYGDWSDKGDVFDCGSPTPESNQVNWGQAFEQTTTCSQNRERTITKKVQDPFSGQIIVESVVTESKIHNKDIRSSEVGTKNYEVSEKLGAWSKLSPIGSPYDCQVIKAGGAIEKTMPVLKYISHSGYKFNMQKPCKSKFERKQTVTGIMADGSQVKKPDNIEHEVQSLNVPETHNAKVGVYSSENTRITVDRKDGSNKHYNSSVYINGKVVFKAPQVSVYDDLLVALDSAGYALGDRITSSYSNDTRYTSSVLKML